eukprot:CAMPEP_0179001702 /NCGR_PEP_ID=MMETSP0795-20121207/11526_1 /TAXON_ID=88552 /ORGANISM="Amoebophrya sp., Strain Ameob2" /LENGTH=1210 /DNA_ID=CAMNT_0020695143 /DNA_START=105 /DNA_END=3738 /DNA_ORIENTATION=-
MPRLTLADLYGVPELVLGRRAARLTINGRVCEIIRESHFPGWREVEHYRLQPVAANSSSSSSNPDGANAMTASSGAINASQLVLSTVPPRPAPPRPQSDYPLLAGYYEVVVWSGDGVVAGGGTWSRVLHPEFGTANRHLGPGLAPSNLLGEIANAGGNIQFDFINSGGAGGPTCTSNSFEQTPEQKNHEVAAAGLKLGLSDAHLVFAAFELVTFLRAIPACLVEAGPQLERALWRYESIWLPLLAVEQSSSGGTRDPEEGGSAAALVPPPDVAWVWAVHMLSPDGYKRDVVDRMLVGGGPSAFARPLSTLMRSVMGISFSSESGSGGIGRSAGVATAGAREQFEAFTRADAPHSAGVHFLRDGFAYSAEDYRYSQEAWRNFCAAKRIMSAGDVTETSGEAYFAPCWTPPVRLASSSSGPGSWSLWEPQESTDLHKGAPRAFQTAFSYDLPAAVYRQRVFNYQINLPHFRDFDFLTRAVDRYKKFLYLKQLVTTPSLTPSGEKHAPTGEVFLVPCYDNDLVWHAHQLHASYAEDTKKIMGGRKMLPHDDSVNDRAENSKLNQSQKKTTKLWEDAFGAARNPFAADGAMFRGLPPARYDGRGLLDSGGGFNVTSRPAVFRPEQDDAAMQRELGLPSLKEDVEFLTGESENSNAATGGGSGQGRKSFNSRPWWHWVVESAAVRSQDPAVSEVASKLWLVDGDKQGQPNLRLSSSGKVLLGKGTTTQPERPMFTARVRVTRKNATAATSANTSLPYTSIELSVKIFDWAGREIATAHSVDGRTIPLGRKEFAPERCLGAPQRVRRCSWCCGLPCELPPGGGFAPENFYDDPSKILLPPLERFSVRKSAFRLATLTHKPNVASDHQHLRKITVNAGRTLESGMLITAGGCDYAASFAHWGDYYPGCRGIKGIPGVSGTKDTAAVPGVKGVPGVVTQFGELRTRVVKLDRADTPMIPTFLTFDHRSVWVKDTNSGKKIERRVPVKMHLLSSDKAHRDDVHVDLARGVVSVRNKFFEEGQSSQSFQPEPRATTNKGAARGEGPSEQDHEKRQHPFAPAIANAGGLALAFSVALQRELMGTPIVNFMRQANPGLEYPEDKKTKVGLLGLGTFLGGVGLSVYDESSCAAGSCFFYSGSASAGSGAPSEGPTTCGGDDSAAEVRAVVAAEDAVAAEAVEAAEAAEAGAAEAVEDEQLGFSGWTDFDAGLGARAALSRSVS